MKCIDYFTQDGALDREIHILWNLPVNWLQLRRHNPDHAAPLVIDGTTGIARLYGCGDLDEILVIPYSGMSIEYPSREDTFGGKNIAQRVTVYRNGFAYWSAIGRGDRRDSVCEGLPFGDFDPQEGKIYILSGGNPRYIFPHTSIVAYGQLGAATNHVFVGHDPMRKIDEESGPTSA